MPCSACTKKDQKIAQLERQLQAIYAGGVPVPYRNVITDLSSDCEITCSLGDGKGFRILKAYADALTPPGPGICVSVTLTTDRMELIEQGQAIGEGEL